MDKMNASEIFTAEEKEKIIELCDMFSAEAIIVAGKKLNVPTPRKTDPVPVG